MVWRLVAAPLAAVQLLSDRKHDDHARGCPLTPMIDDTTLYRLSTDRLPERDRMAIWREVCTRKVMRLEADVVADADFHADVAVRAFPGLVTLSGDFRGIRLRRTRELLPDGNDDLVLVLNLSGVAIPSQLGRELTLRDGDAVLMSSEEVSTFLYPAAGARNIVLRMRRRALAELVPGVEDLPMRPLPRDSEALRLLTSYVGILHQGHALTNPLLRHHVVAHVHDLVALSLGAAREAAVVAHGRGVHAARLRALKADIAEHMSHADFRIAGVAARHGITPRHVQRLFEGEGTTFSKYVLDQRLARAHRLLCDPRCAAHSISTIAGAVGFGDLSYFNRTFRRRYGAAPSDVRATMLGRDSAGNNPRCAARED